MNVSLIWKLQSQPVLSMDDGKLPPLPNLDTHRRWFAIANAFAECDSFSFNRCRNCWEFSWENSIAICIVTYWSRSKWSRIEFGVFYVKPTKSKSLKMISRPDVDIDMFRLIPKRSHPKRHVVEKRSFPSYDQLYYEPIQIRTQS